jgi:hypothetical protein
MHQQALQERQGLYQEQLPGQLQEEGVQVQEEEDVAVMGHQHHQHHYYYYHHQQQQQQGGMKTCRLAQRVRGRRAKAKGGPRQALEQQLVMCRELERRD